MCTSNLLETCQLAATLWVKTIGRCWLGTGADSEAGSLDCYVSLTPPAKDKLSRNYNFDSLRVGSCILVGWPRAALIAVQVPRTMWVTAMA
jgi:hypothetical protein